VVTAKMKWTGGLKFEGISAWGHKIVTDADKQAGGEEVGYKPTELLLYGIAGCTGIDVVRILEKQRQQLNSLEIELIAHQNEKYPKPFHTIEVKFTARGKNLSEEKVAKAIELSEGKYCVVSQTVIYPGQVVSTHEVINE